MKTKLLPVGLAVVGAISSHAGPVVIDGTDANSHGFVSAGVNFNGWEYMQRVLENLGPQVGNGNKVVVTLGSQAATTARLSIDSAFSLSSLVGASWSIGHIDGEANIATYLGGGTVGGLSLANTGILYLPTAGETTGDMTIAEVAALNLNAAAIANFVGGAGNPLVGGGLFSQGELVTGGYGWLSTLIPGIVFTGVGAGTDITLTAAGALAFPGLSNADMAGADPWHGYFSGNLGSLSVLGTALDGGGVARNVIIGGGAGTVITPDPPAPPSAVPEVSTVFSAGAFAGLIGFCFLRRRRESATA